MFTRVLILVAELVYEIDCSYNYRPDHCMYGSGCPAAEEQGVRILHANRRAAVTDKFPPFRLIYQAIQQVIIIMSYASNFEKGQIDFFNLNEIKMNELKMKFIWQRFLSSQWLN